MASPYRCMVSRQEIDKRIQVLQTHLARQGLGGALIVQKVDRFYYTGTTQQGWLYVPVDGAPLLMVFKDLDRARAESPIPSIVPLMSPKKRAWSLRWSPRW